MKWKSFWQWEWSTTTYNNMNEPHKHNVEWKKPERKKPMLSNSIHMEVKNGQNWPTVTEVKIPVNFGELGRDWEEEVRGLLGFW